MLIPSSQSSAPIKQEAWRFLQIKVRQLSDHLGFCGSHTCQGLFTSKNVRLGSRCLRIFLDAIQTLSEHACCSQCCRGRCLRPGVGFLPHPSWAPAPVSSSDSCFFGIWRRHLHGSCCTSFSTLSLLRLFCSETYSSAASPGPVTSASSGAARP